MATYRLCSIPDCFKRAIKRGWCGALYERYRVHGSPTGGGTAWGEPVAFLVNTVLPYEGDGCLFWPYGTNGSGYGTIRGKLVSRMVCEHHHGSPPSLNHEAAHSCGNGHLGCVAKRHLFWRTHAGNMAETLRHGTLPRGEANGQSKLTLSSVLEIRRLAKELTQAEIARRFGVSPVTIHSIVKGTTWGWATPQNSPSD